jgi:virulence factor Mce-like protein
LIRLASILTAVVVAGAAVAIVLPHTRQKQITVTAYFTKTIGLFPQSHVRVLGVSIGRVSSVAPAGDRVKVVMRISAERAIPADAHAFIVPISLISDRYVQLTPVYSSGAKLRDGDVIPLEHTSIPSELDDVLAQLKKFLDAVQVGSLQDPQAIGVAIRNLSSALSGTGADLSTTLGGAGALSRSDLAHLTEIDSIIAHYSSLTAALVQRRDDLARLNTGLAQALGAIAGEHQTLDSALRDVALLTDQLGTLVHDHRSALETDLVTLFKTTQVLTRHQDSLIRTLDWLPVLADGAEGSHDGGAIHGTPTHVDVRDAHLYTCPPAVPAPVCLLIGLSGGALVASGPAPAPSPRSAAAAPGTAPTPGPVDLLDLLPKGPLPAGVSGTPDAAPSPGPVRGFFERLGGLLDGAMGWFS